MSIPKKSNPKRTILVWLLVVLVMVVYVFLTDDGSSAPTDTPDVSVEAPAEPETKEPTNPIPAIIGGAAAIAVYYVGSVAISALKKGKKKSDEK